MALEEVTLEKTEKTVEVTEEKLGFFTKVKLWGKAIKDGTTEFIVENPAMTMPILTGLIMFGGGIIKGLTGSSGRKLDRCKVQDPITGEYFLADHPLTNSEIRELGDRMSSGEDKGEALENMGLLRNEKKRK